MAQETIDKIINIQFKYSDLVEGWSEASKAIDNAKKRLDEFKEAGDSAGVAKQTQLIKALRGEMNQFTREIQANVKEEVKADGSINQLNARIAKLTAQYNAMSGEIRKSAVGEALAKEIADVQTEVNKANEAVLNFRNNVGNYASAAKGFTPLKFQVQQVAREIPSLNMSLQQFFLAISNNLPMLSDELMRAKNANKALKAEGKATIPVFKQVVSAIFSWQTALVVGITLLTAYGKEIAAWVKSLFSAKEASISMKEATENINKAIKEGGYGIGDQISKIKSLQSSWNALGGDLEARKKFVTENKEAFDDLGVKVDDVNDAENLLVKNTGSFTDALKFRAVAAAGMKLAAEAYEKALIKQQEVEEKIKKGYTTTISSAGGSFGGGYTKVTREYTEEEKKQMMQEVDALNQQADAYLTLSVERQKSAKQALENAGIEEQANDKQNESIQQIMTLEDMLYKLRQKNTKKYTGALSKQQQEWGKLAEKLESDIEKAMLATDKEIGQSFREQIAYQQQIYQNRIAEARLQNGELGAAREMLDIYKEQLENLNNMESVYRAAGYTDIEIQAIRIRARQEVANAEDNIADIQFQNTQKALSQAAETAGAMSSAFEALGGEGERYAAFAKAFAIMQVILTQANAIAGAVEAGAKGTTWFMIPLTIASAIAAVTAAIASSVNTVKSTEVPKYASGGIVSGAGTATSDSVPAMLSNGEAVMTAAAVNEWGAMLSAMNVSSGGNAINVSNLPQRGDGMRGMERMMERVMLRMPAPVVSVVDINKGQRNVKVQESISKLGRRNKINTL